MSNAEKPPRFYVYRDITTVHKDDYDAVVKERDEYVREAEHFQNKCIDLDLANGLLTNERDALAAQLIEAHRLQTVAVEMSSKFEAQLNEAKQLIEADNKYIKRLERGGTL